MVPGISPDLLGGQHQDGPVQHQQRMLGRHLSDPPPVPPLHDMPEDPLPAPSAPTVTTTPATTAAPAAKRQKIAPPHGTCPLCQYNVDDADRPIQALACGCLYHKDCAEDLARRTKKPIMHACVIPHGIDITLDVANADAGEQQPENSGGPASSSTDVPALSDDVLHQIHSNRQAAVERRRLRNLPFQIAAVDAPPIAHVGQANPDTVVENPDTVVVVDAGEDIPDTTAVASEVADATLVEDARAAIAAAATQV